VADATSRDPAASGLLGTVRRMVAAREQANDPWAAAANGILGGIAKLTPAWAPTSAPPIDATQGLLEPFVGLKADASYAPGPRPFLSSDPTGYQGGSLKVVAVGAGNGYCPACVEAIEDAGGLATGRRQQP
jgi:hypothetical protein